MLQAKENNVKALSDALVSHNTREKNTIKTTVTKS